MKKREPRPTTTSDCHFTIANPDVQLHDDAVEFMARLLLERRRQKRSEQEGQAAEQTPPGEALG